jgi:hypothetical protein
MGILFFRRKYSHVVTRTNGKPVLLQQELFNMMVKATPKFLQSCNSEIVPDCFAVPNILWIDHPERLYDIAWLFTKRGICLGCGLANLSFSTWRCC